MSLSNLILLLTELFYMVWCGTPSLLSLLFRIRSSVQMPAFTSPVFLVLILVYQECHKNFFAYYHTL